MDSRRVTKADKTNPVNTRKIVIKRVTSLPKDKKNELYNPFSCVSEEASLQQSPDSDGETNMYDPFEPTESDEEKPSFEHHDNNLEICEETAEKVKGEITSQVKINDEAPEVQIDSATVTFIDDKTDKSISAALQSENQQEVSEDIFMDLDDDNQGTTAETHNNETAGTSEKTNFKQHDEVKVCKQTMLDVIDSDVEQTLGFESNSLEDSVNVSDIYLEESQTDDVESHARSSEISSKHKKQKKRSKQLDDETTYKRGDEKPLEAKTDRKEPASSRHREKKSKHSKKDKNDKDMSKVTISLNADEDTKQNDIEEIEVIEQEEEGEIIDEPKFVIKKRVIPKTVKRLHSAVKNVETDKDVVEFIGRNKKSHKDFDAEESKPKHRKIKRKSSEYKGEDSTKDEKHDIKRKGISYERKEVDGKKKQKSDRSSDREKSVEYRYSEHRRKSAIKDKESDNHHRDKDDHRNSHRDSRYHDRKSDKEGDYHNMRRSKTEKDSYRGTHRRSSHYNERDKERDPCDHRKWNDKYHDEEKSERRPKHHHRDDEFNDFYPHKDSKSRKSLSTEPHRNDQSKIHVKSNDKDSKKRSRDKSLSVERYVGYEKSKLVAQSSNDISHRKHSTHRSKPLQSEVTWKSKECERSMSWRSTGEENSDTESELTKKYDQHSTEKHQTRDKHHNKRVRSEGSEKPKKRKLSHPEKTHDHHTHVDSLKRSSRSKKSKRKHSKNKLSCSPSSVEDFSKPDKKLSKYKKKKKKRQSSVESADFLLQNFKSKTSERCEVSADEFSVENDEKSDHDGNKLGEKAIHETGAKSPVETFYEELDITDSLSPLPTSDQLIFQEVEKKETEVAENWIISPCDTHTPQNLSNESPIRDDAVTEMPDSSPQSPLVTSKDEVKSHHNIKESLSFAEEFVEQSRKRWKERKSSVASSNDSPQLYVLSDSESKSNHRNLVETENIESNGSVLHSATDKIPGLSISKSPVGDTDFRLHDFDARSQDIEVDLFEDSHQSPGSSHHTIDNGLPSDDAGNSTKELTADSKKTVEPEISPADMILDSENSGSDKGSELEEKLNSNKLSEPAGEEKVASAHKNEDAISKNNGEKTLLNPTQILNRIGLNPQQHSAAQNAILSLAELSKHLDLDKLPDHLIKKNEKGKSGTPAEIESSAVELHNKDKKRGHLKKLKFQEKVIEEAKSAIKPYYESRQISKSEYKDILKKAVNKIYSSETTREVNTVKIRRLIRRYIEKYQQKKSMKKDKSKPKVSKSPLAPQYQPLTSTSEGKPGMSIPLPFSKREPKKTFTLPDLPLPPPPPPPKR